MRQTLPDVVRWLRRILLALALIATLATVAVLFGWVEDRALLREVAVAQSRNYESIPERIIALNHWVYENRGFAKNRNFYLFESFGPTPVQVLREGGDCADKSRLLAALLAEIDVESTLVMLYPCRECEPVHTLVEARATGLSMALDPVYDLYVPDGNGRYLGIEEISQHPTGLWDRVLELRRARGTKDKINFYRYSPAHFENARTVNWNRNVVTRAAGMLIAASGRNAFRVSRPRFLEDPKLFVGLGLLISAGVCVGLYGLTRLLGRLAQRVAQERLSGPRGSVPRV